ncbi:unnamed protein product [Rhizoctonia solani]|uniref:CFEM domain-containing protein n=1 Tax=Rhizoctonia solani TaxID=456999 RepID=A0A8H3GC98_9AGAM|nr:unnamed protein product [Rhizoctonia solani]
MKFVFTFAVLFAGYAATQSATTSADPPINTGNIPPCIFQCGIQAAETAGCTSIMDATCLCSKNAFQTAAEQCLQSNCTVADQQTGFAWQQQICVVSDQ